MLFVPRTLRRARSGSRPVSIASQGVASRSHSPAPPVIRVQSSDWGTKIMFILQENLLLQDHQYWITTFIYLSISISELKIHISDIKYFHLIVYLNTNQIMLRRRWIGLEGVNRLCIQNVSNFTASCNEASSVVTQSPLRCLNFKFAMNRLPTKVIKAISPFIIIRKMIPCTSQCQRCSQSLMSQTLLQKRFWRKTLSQVLKKLLRTGFFLARERGSDTWLWGQLLRKLADLWCFII